MDLPESVSTLELKFRFDGEVSEGVLRSLRMRYFGRIAMMSAGIGSMNFGNSLNALDKEDDEAGHTLPGVKTLAVSGACPELVLDLINMCVNLETLEVDETMDLRELADLLPSRVKTLVLGGEDGFELSVEVLHGLRFTHALREGLMSNEQDKDEEEENEGERERKIVLVTRRVEERALQIAREDCEFYKVPLVHRPITDIV